ncbi:MAG: AIR synthase-related protein, partial [Fidelibacterota bacterium]
GLSREDYALLVEHLGRRPTSIELQLVGSYWRTPSPSSVFRMVPSSLSQLVPEVQQVNTGARSALILRSSSCQLPLSGNIETRVMACISTAVGAVSASGGEPLVIAYSRYVGSWEKRGMKKRIGELAAAAEEYGQAVGIPTRTGELVSEVGYEAGPIFLALVLGLVRGDKKVLPVARGAGNPVYLLGPRSSGMDDSLGAEKDRIDICRDLSQRSYLVGMESVGSQGLAVSCARMATNSGFGLTLNMARMPGLYKGMTGEEILFLDILGRVVVVIAQGFETELRRICRKSAIRCSRIGRVDQEEVFRIQRGKTDYATLPLQVFFDRPERVLHEPRPQETAGSENTPALDVSRLSTPSSYSQTLMELLRTPNILVDTLMAAGRDGHARSVIELPGNGSSRAVTVHMSSGGRFAHLDPRSGGRFAAMAALRRSVCRGAVPKGALSGLIVGSESGPPIMREALEGQAEVLNGAGVPVVNLYVDWEMDSVYPTPVAGVVGFLEGSDRILTPQFKDPEDFVLLLGSHRGELGGSEYLNFIHGRIDGPPPVADMAVEHRIHEIVLMAHREGLTKSAQPVSRGGLSVTLIQCLVGAAEGRGVRIHMSSKLRDDELLFGETQGLVIVTIHEDSLIEIERLCMRMGVPCTAIGRVTDDGLFSFDGLVRLEVREVKKLFTRGVRKLVWG